MTSKPKLSAVPAILAVLALTATPASAADLSLPMAAASPVGDLPVWSVGDDSTDYHRRYRYRRHRGVDAGDVLAGVLILGGIAAVASAAKNANRRDRNRDWRYPQRRSDYRTDYDARGIDRAVSMCVDEIERNARVDSVDNVSRNARGWDVSGSLYDGQGFSCSIGADGRIDGIDYGRVGRIDNGDYSYEARDDRQYDDEYYTAMRARSDAQTTYPGGPVASDEDIDADIEYGTGYQGVGN